MNLNKEQNKSNPQKVFESRRENVIAQAELTIRDGTLNLKIL